MTPSKIFFYFCLSFIGGIFISSLFKISLPLMLGFLVLGIFFISVFWPYKKLVVVGFSILFLVFGVWRHQLAELKIINNELKKLNDSGQEITLIGLVFREPDIREKSQKLIIKTEEIGHHYENISRSIEGKVLVATKKYPEYQYGDKLKIIGKLENPKGLGDFDYPGYLAKDGIYSVIYWPKIELLERNQGNFLYAKILNFKNRLRESIYQNLSSPQSSILAAMILGDKRQVSDELKQGLNMAGLRHITAISGLHVTTLTTILMTILIGLGFWRQQAFWFSLVLITLFILMTGLQLSAIRAGIMGSFFLIAQYLGRMSASSRSIVFAGAIMLAQNPLLLKLDVGFQLSFLAMMGIIYLGPIFRDWFRKIPNSFQLRSILAMTLAAQVFTLPILIYNFGYLSFVSPITNVLVVPLLYWLMLFGFLFAIFGAIWQPLAQILSLPVWLLLTYITKIVEISSKIPFASKILEISWLWLIISYLILTLITWQLNKKQKLKFLEY